MFVKLLCSARKSKYMVLEVFRLRNELMLVHFFFSEWDLCRCCCRTMLGAHSILLLVYMVETKLNFSLLLYRIYFCICDKRKWIFFSLYLLHELLSSNLRSHKYRRHRKYKFKFISKYFIKPRYFYLSISGA